MRYRNRNLGPQKIAFPWSIHDSPSEIQRSRYFPVTIVSSVSNVPTNPTPPELEQPAPSPIRPSLFNEFWASFPMHSASKRFRGICPQDGCRPGCRAGVDSLLSGLRRPAHGDPGQVSMQSMPQNLRDLLRGRTRLSLDALRLDPIDSRTFPPTF